METKIYINTLINLTRANMYLYKANENTELVDVPLSIAICEVMERLDYIINKIDEDLS